MNRYKLLTLLNLGLIVFMASCGESNNANIANQNTANVINTAGNLPEINANLPNANSGIPDANSGTPVNPTVPGNAAILKPSPGKINPSLPSQPAPDNSEVTVALGENLVQTRVFKNHPRINKIESVTAFVDGSEKKSVKIFLKNGQVRELSEGKIKDPMTETADNILKALG
ncbi:MAG TPA: hypothetical protein VK892_20560 [Pyrinomonadaceae bacterium]|nr:hypothetical protein [Pyrinomonadaceae bacterium]